MRHNLYIQATCLLFCNADRMAMIRLPTPVSPLLTNKPSKLQTRARGGTSARGWYHLLAGRVDNTAHRT